MYPSHLTGPHVRFLRNPLELLEVLRPVAGHPTDERGIRQPLGQQDVPMTNNEDAILQHAEIIVDAVALGQAMLDGDLQEARFRARLIATNADIAGLSDVGRAVGRVVDLLGRGSTAPRPGCGQAIEALSVAIDQASSLSPSCQPDS